MRSFFSRFKDHLDGDYGGRYLEVILSEVIKEDLSILKILFPAIDGDIIKSKNIEIAVEEIFPSKVRQHRRADLVVKLNGKHKALLEIKYADKALERQIPDYIKYADKNKLCFTYLTQYIPPKEDLDTITAKNSSKYSHLLYATLYKKIKKHGKVNKPLTNLFINFMEEQFMIYNEALNEDALQLLLIKGLYVKHAAGFRRKVSEDNVKSIPSLWDTLIDNVKVLGDRFYNEFPNYFNNRFSIDFAFDPEFDLKKLKKDIDASIKDGDGDDYSELNRDRKTGGYFWINAAGKIKQANKDDYLYLAIGYSFYLDLDKKQLTKYLYCCIYGKGFKIIDKDKKIRSQGQLPSENVCYLNFLKLCDEAIKQVLDDNRDLLDSFKVSLCGLKAEIKKKMS
jgi:hypothetical protein